MSCFTIHVQHGDIFRAHGRHSFGQRAAYRIPHPPHDTQDQVFAMRFQQKCILPIPQRRLNEHVTKFRLQCRVKVYFRLLDGNNGVFRAVGADKHRQNLTDANTNIPMTYNSVKTLVSKYKFFN